MNFHVIWLAPALDELAKIWLAVADRTSIAKASDEIDAILGRTPLEVGESREGFNRILIHGPLSVYYVVSEAEGRVYVWDVWLVK